MRVYGRHPEEDRLRAIEICELYGIEPIDVKWLTVGWFRVKFYCYVRDKDGFLSLSGRTVQLEPVVRWRKW